MINRYMAMSVGVLLLSGAVLWSVYGQENPPKVVERADPEARLEQIRTELEQAATVLRDAEAQAKRYRHDILYTNQHISVIYKQLRALEMQAMEKRKALDTEIQKDPQYRELMRTRNAAHRKVRELRGLEKLLLKRKDQQSNR